MDASVPLGVMLPVVEEAGRIVELAQRTARAGIDELWVAEDLGLQGGMPARRRRPRPSPARAERSRGIRQMQ